jgi:phospholipid/cholesterol/gamma-HCH transport system ATP-binding protein
VPDPIIRFVDVRKSFGDKVVLDGLDLSLERGRTSVIIGPSGTGKSVTIKLLVGLLQPDEGEIWIDDVRVDTAGERALLAVRRRIGMLFQDGALFDSMSVGDNVAFPLRRHRTLGEDEIRTRVATVLGQVGLPGIEERLPASLSGGMRKRVGLARAIVLEPDIVLFDEPHSGLDPMTSDEIDALIGRMKAELGMTFVIISHDIVGTFRLADHIAMLYQGRLVAQGPPDELRRSADPVVRRFLSRNLGVSP